MTWSRSSLQPTSDNSMTLLTLLSLSRACGCVCVSPGLRTAGAPAQRLGSASLRRFQLPPSSLAVAQRSIANIPWLPRPTLIHHASLTHSLTDDYQVWIVAWLGLKWSLAVCLFDLTPFMGTLKPQSNGPLYSNAVIGTLAVDGWTVSCYICYSEEGTGSAVAPPSPFLAVPDVTTHPSSASVPTSYQSMWHSAL